MSNTTLILNSTVISAGTCRANSGLYIDGNGRIADVFSMDDFNRSRYAQDAMEIDAQGKITCAGLIDTHIHGIGGFSTEDNSTESILKMSECLARFGVTSFLPTLYAGKPDKMEREVKAAVKAIGKEKGARIIGINLEGPFLSPEKCGAQNVDAMTLPSADVMNRLLDAGEGKVLAMTVAPELEGIEAVAEIAEKRGVVLLMGHTNATYEQARHGVDIGIRHATHMFNAMSPLNHKNPGVAGNALMDDRMRCEIIADGVHVNRDLVEYVIRTKPRDNVVLITDSLGPTSLGKGRFMANGMDIVLGEKGAFVDATDQSRLCGSALTLNVAVRNVTTWGTDLAYAIKLATENPAKVYSLKGLGTIAKGCLADVVIFNDSLEPEFVFISGKIVHQKSN